MFTNEFECEKEKISYIELISVVAVQRNLKYNRTHSYNLNTFIQSAH